MEGGDLKNKYVIYTSLIKSIVFVLFTTYLFIASIELIRADEITFNVLMIAFVGGLYSVLGYGFNFYAPYLIISLIGSTIIKKANYDKIFLYLLFESVIVAVSLIYLAAVHGSLVLVFIVLAFLLSQMYFRRLSIKKSYILRGQRFT